MDISLEVNKWPSSKIHFSAMRGMSGMCICPRELALSTKGHWCSVLSSCFTTKRNYGIIPWHSSGAFYRAMLCRARLCHSMWSVRQSVRLSATFRYRDYIGWNTSRIISRLISWKFALGLTPTWAIWCNGNIPKIRVE